MKLYGALDQPSCLSFYSRCRTQKIIKKIKHALQDADIEDTVNLDALDAYLALRDFDGNGDSEAEDRDKEIFDNFDIADAVGKALALIKQVCYHHYS